MDDDVIAGPGLASGHALRHEAADHLVVLGYMPVPVDDGVPATSRLYAREYEAHCARLESGDLAVLGGLWLGNVSARRRDLERVGVSSEQFPLRYHGDTDLGLRLAAAGAHGVFDRRLAATHHHAQSQAAFLRDARERGEALGLLKAQHPDDTNAERTLSRLPGPAEHAVSFLARGRRAGASSRLLMALGTGAERLGWHRWRAASRSCAGFESRWTWGPRRPPRLMSRRARSPGLEGSA
jgi:hypothetical protein